MSREARPGSDYSATLPPAQRVTSQPPEARGCASARKFARPRLHSARVGLVRMLRRKFLQACLIATAWFVAGAHTPYRQWQVYRRRHLLIGTSKADEPTYPLGQKVAELLATHLPRAAPG